MRITVCVGSSCHVRGSRQALMRFAELLNKHGLTESVSLHGAFCMERCQDGINWMIDDDHIASSSVDEAIATFSDRVLGTADNG